MQSLVRKARANVRFLPTILTILAVFIVPVTFYQGHLISTQAHAGWFANEIADILLWIPAKIAWLIFKLASLIFTFAVWFFDFALDYSTKGSTYANMAFINTAWTFIRDLINSGFIFAVLAIAFKQLLSTDEVNTSSLQKTLVKIIVAALLINFSLFFTKVAVDASNVVTRGIYYRMQTTDAAGAQPHYGPAYALAQGLDLFSFLDMKQKDVNSLNTTIIYGAGSLLMIISSLLFFVAAFMFISRIFVLMIVMMTSPLLFASYALNFPSINKYRDQWVSALKSQALFPIVYMLVIYIAVIFVRSDSFTLKGLSFATAFSGGPEASASFTLIVNYIIVTALMVYALKAAKDAGGAATKYGSKFSGLAMGKLSATAAWTGRSTLGAAGGAISRSKMLQNKVATGGFLTKTTANWAIRGGEKAAQSSFDIRASRAYGFADKQVGGVGAGAASTKTFAKEGSGLAGVGALGTRLSTIAGEKQGVLAGAARGLARGAQVVGGGEKSSEDALKKREAAIIKEITERYKDNPAAAEAMIRSTLGMGSARFESKAGREVRAKLATQARVSDAKDTLKNKEALAAASGTAPKKPEHEKALEEKKKHEAAGTPVPPATLSEIKKFEDEAKKAQKEAQKKLADAARIVKPEDVAGLEVKTLETLAKSNALTVAHIKEIEKLILENNYTPDDKTKLDAMAKELRKTGSDTVRSHLTSSKIKDMTPFALGFDEDVTSAKAVFSDANASTESKAAAKKSLTEAMRALDARELRDMDHNVILDRNVLSHIPPPKLAAYIKNAKDTGNTEAVDMAEQEAVQIDQVISTTTDKKAKASLTAYANALRGQGGGKKNKNNP